MKTSTQRAWWHPWKDWVPCIEITREELSLGTEPIWPTNPLAHLSLGTGPIWRTNSLAHYLFLIVFLFFIASMLIWNIYQGSWRGYQFCVCSYRCATITRSFSPLCWWKWSRDRSYREQFKRISFLLCQIKPSLCSVAPGQLENDPFLWRGSAFFKNSAWFRISLGAA